MGNVEHKPRRTAPNLILAFFLLVTTGCGDNINVLAPACVAICVTVLVETHRVPPGE